MRILLFLLAFFLALSAHAEGTVGTGQRTTESGTSNGFIDLFLSILDMFPW